MKLSYLFPLLLVVSCAWNQKDINTIERPEEDLVVSLEVDQDISKKFLETEISKAPKKSISKKNKKNKRSKKIITQIKKEVEKKRYPKDYPKKFIDYNKQYSKSWSVYEPLIFEGEEMLYNVHFLGVNVGKVFLRTLPSKMIGKREAFHFRADLKSAPFYNYVYRLDDYIESFIDAKTYLPIKYTLIQRESGKDVDDLQVFDFETLKTSLFYKRIKKGEKKKENKTGYMPAYFQDVFSAIQFVRGLPLKLNVPYEFPLVNRTKIQIVNYRVVKKEMIKVNKKSYKALKIKAITRFPGVKKKKGDITLWMSDDDKRILLKFSANIKIGSVRGELARYKGGERL